MNHSENLEKFKTQLIEHFKSDTPFSIQSIDSGASVRRYYLLEFKDISHFNNSKVILMKIPGNRLEIFDDYCEISHYLHRHQIAHPEIFEVQREQGWIFLEPATGERLDKYAHDKDNSELATVYSALIDYLIQLQKELIQNPHCPVFKRHFNFDKYMYEFRFHVKEQLLEKFYGYRLSDTEEHTFNKFASRISQSLDSDIPVFVHRDFQSSNIFIHRQNEAYFFQIIDFQDARSGNALYDLVSLLWDSYINLPDQLRKNLIYSFYQKHSLVRETFSREEYNKYIHFTIIQRKLHDAGAFIYSYYLTKNKNYIQYINAALEMAKQVIEIYPEFSDIKKIFKKVTGTKHD